MESDAVAAGPPQNCDKASNPEALGHDRQDVLAAHQAAVEERQAWKCHKEHKGSRYHLECVMTRPRSADFGIEVGVGDVATSAIADIGLKIRQAFLNAWRFELRSCSGSRSV